MSATENGSILDETIAPIVGSVEETEVAEAVSPPPSITDVDAFPTLGSASTPTSSAVSWGPSMKTAVSTPVSSASSVGSFPGAARSKNVQEAFNISSSVSLQLAKSDFVKIVNDLKKKHSVSMESTLSSKTNDRSFIVTGKLADVKAAKRELVRRLTKPVVITFQVPAATRSAIIGAGGKNLKPIIDSTATKIEIERKQTPSPDANGDEEELISVTIEGDGDGVQEAKRRIVEIVREETKILTVKITVSQKLQPFVKPFETTGDDLTITGPNKNGLIIISGLRDEVLSKKNELSDQLDTLSSNIKTEVKTIPKKYHQLINLRELLAQYDVVVEIPSGDADEQVKFIGLPQNLTAAIQSARDTSSQYTIDSLLISKAHGSNVVHSRYLAAFLTHSGLLSGIGSENSTKVTAPTYKQLASADLNSVSIETTALNTEGDALRASKKAIIDFVNRFGPSRFLIVSDISSFFSKKVASAVAATAKEQNVHVVPLSELSGDLTHDIVLVALDGKDDEFAPTQEEIDDRLNATSAALDGLRATQADLIEVTLDIPSDKQQFIEGPSGTTLNRLITSVGQVVLKLHSDGKHESPDSVFIHGTKADVAKIQKDIDVLLKDSADQKDIYSFVVDSSVPTTVLSRLIGKSGSYLKEISEKYAVQIDISKDTSAEKTDLRITGYKFNVQEAEQFISLAAKRWIDETTKVLIVPKQYRASMIGANGQNVKKLQTKYNVSINFNRADDEVLIKGPSRGVVKAAEELQDLLDFEIANGYVKVIQVPDAAIARVIGRAGETVNRIAVDSGIEIRVEEHDGESEKRTVTLTGSRKGLTEAEKKILEIVKEIEDTVTVELEVDPKYFKDILGTKGATKEQILTEALAGQEGSARLLLHVPDAASESNVLSSTGPKKVVDRIITRVKQIIAEKESTVTETLEVAKEKHRLLIGPGGSTRRSLEDAFKVSLNVPRSSDKSTSVTISGQPSSVEKAKAKVIELTADTWKAVVDVPVYVHAAVFQRGLFSRELRLHHNVEVSFGDSHKKAQNLSNKTPALPADVRGTDEETFKYTTITVELNKDSSETIPWRLSGEDEDVTKAKQDVLNAIKKHSEDDTIGFLWIKEPAMVFPKIVGTQGSRLNNVRRKSGAEITVPKSTDKVKDVIFLQGRKSAVEKAEKLLRADVNGKESV